MKTMLCVMLFVISFATLVQAGNVATETIDYAIEKLSQLQPEAQKLGKEYVEYTVWKAHVHFRIAIGLLFAGICMLAIGIPTLIKTNRKAFEAVGSILTVVGLTLTLICGAVSIRSWYNVQCADRSPLIYTIENSPITCKIVK